MIFLILVVSLAVLAYIFGSPKIPKQNGLYSHRVGVWYAIKATVLTAFLSVLQLGLRYFRFKNRKSELQQLTVPAKISRENNSHDLSFVACDNQGNIVVVRIRRLFGFISEISLVIRLKNGNVLTLPRRQFYLDESPLSELEEDRVISSGGLRIRVIHPGKTYRLVFSGLMLQRSSGKQARENVNVTFRLWFRAISDPAHYSVDFSAQNLAKCLAAEDRIADNLAETLLQTSQQHYEQFGELRGLIDVTPGDGEKLSTELTLYGIRDHRCGANDSEPDGGFFSLRVKFDRGFAFSLHVECHKQRLTHLVTGFVSYPGGFIYPIRWTDFHLSNIPVDGSLPQQMTINIAAHGRFYSLAIESFDFTSQSKRTIDKNLSLKVNSRLVKATLDDDQIGYGLIEFNNRGEMTWNQTPDDVTKYLIHRMAPPQYPETYLPKFLSLQDPLSRLSSLTGGKASKLADILEVKKAFQGDAGVDRLKVPAGFVVTTAAFDEFMTSHPKIAAKIALVTRKTEDISELCKEIHEEIMSAKLVPGFLQEVRRNLDDILGGQNVFTAVRSSAVGEDGGDISAAGQMETFLGRKGVDSISEAIRQCWASTFSFRAIQYRRQMGAKLDTPVAVIVQQMVDPDVAGVVFTRHPDDGSTSHTVINACYGIGEGVVSGVIHPDTISVRQVNANNENAIEITYDVLGDKAGAFKVNENRGSLEVTNLEPATDRCCLERSEIEGLYETGKLIEKVFGAGRDIEFALKRSSAQDIYILQARPITTSELETQWELLHEFDSPLASDCELLTTANVQEMMPGPLAPLSLQLWMQTISFGIDWSGIRRGLRAHRRFGVHRCIHVGYEHIFFNRTVTNAGAITEFNKKIGEIAVFGREDPDVKIEHFMEQNDMDSFLWKAYYKLLTLRAQLKPEKTPLDKKEQRILKRDPIATNNPVTLLELIETKMVPFAKEVWADHCYITLIACVGPITLMAILDKSLNFGPQLYEDVATMLSSCPNTYSADVPTLLQEIAVSIKESEEDCKVFTASNRQDAADWLLSQDSHKHGELFRKFLTKHGHRCVRDSDIREKSWAQEPAKVVDALRGMVASDLSENSVSKQQKVEMSVDEALDLVKMPMTTIQRILLRRVLQRARQKVAEREWSKSLAIMSTDHYRMAYYKVAELLTEMGHIPDADLAYFFSHDELKVVAARRSPKLVLRAIHRRRNFSKFQNMQFNELMTGHPEPSSDEDSMKVPGQDANLSVLKGMAVGNGSVQGLARVVKSLPEANQIQKGEILVASYTDVGWTPYFPLVSGLVTELGGLISHGAVVAREYGLPCVVGCKRATDIIETGDLVKIDSQTGNVAIVAKNGNI